MIHLSSDYSIRQRTGLCLYSTSNHCSFSGWRWFAGATSGVLAVSEAATVQISLVDNAVDSNSNRLNRDLTGDSITDAYIYGDAGVTTYNVTYSNLRYKHHIDFASVNWYFNYDLAKAQVATTRIYSLVHGLPAGVDSQNYRASIKNTAGGGDATTTDKGNPVGTSALVPVSFSDARINSGATTAGFLEIRAFNNSFAFHSVQLLRLVFDDSSTGAPAGVTAGGVNAEWEDPVAKAAFNAQIRKKLKKLKKKLRKAKKKEKITKARRLKKKIKKLRKLLR